MAAKGFDRMGFPVHFKFECVLLTVITVCGFFLAKSGVLLGHTAWLPLPEIRYEQFGLTRHMAASWDNMISLSLAILLAGSYARDVGRHRQHLFEFAELSASYIKSTNRYVRVLILLVCVALMYAMSIVCETFCPSPAGNMVSVLLDGVFFRAAMLCILYFSLWITPYVFAREYLIFTGKFTLAHPDNSTRNS